MKSAPSAPAVQTTGFSGEGPPSSGPKSTPPSAAKSNRPVTSTATPPAGTLSPETISCTARCARSIVLNGLKAEPSPSSLPFAESTRSTRPAEADARAGASFRAGAARLIDFMIRASCFS